MKDIALQHSSQIPKKKAHKERKSHNKGQHLENMIEKVKKEGPFPLVHLDNCTRGWAIPPADKFLVRGPDYLTTNIKIPSGDCLLKPLGFDWVRSSSKISHILSQERGRVKKALLEGAFIWAFNIQLPVDNLSLIFYFFSTSPVQPGSLVDRFLKGDDDFRKSRLKMISQVVHGPRIVKAVLRKQALSKPGNATTCIFNVGKNYAEVDVDVGASIVGRTLVRLTFGYMQTLTMDIAFLIEGQSESELPEQLLGAIRFSGLDPESAGYLDDYP